MRLSIKKWLIVAGVLMISGLIAGLVGMTMLGFDFTKLNTMGKQVNNTYDIENEVSSIDIDVSTADIYFETAENEKVRVECIESENVQHQVKLEAGKLKITMRDERPWYKRFFGFGNSDMKLTVYLPEDIKLSDVKLQCSTGDVYIKGREIDGELKIDLSTGQVNLEDVRAKSADIESSTGKIDAKGVIIAGKLKIDTSTGDVNFLKGDAESVYIDTSTGDINCSFLSEKNIKANSSTGDVSVPSGGSGGECKLSTSTGDIKATYE